MVFPDDSSLTPMQYKRVKKEAEKALRESGAFGVLPTPMDAIMKAANLTEVKEDVLNPSFIDKLREEASQFGDVLKRAVSKVLGIFHAPSGMVFIDQSLMKVKKRFVGFHESAHGFMPWQKSMYSHVEDSQVQLEPSAAELFDREANVFASEVMFQLDSFQEQASDHEFNIKVPLKLARQFEASTYAAIRQYVSKHHKSCAVVVFNMPEFAEDVGFTATIRRYQQSSSFSEMFGNYRWPDRVTPDDDIGTFVPLGKRKMTGQRAIVLNDLNGDAHECIAEGYTNTYQVFILIHVVKALKAKSIILPAA